MERGLYDLVSKPASKKTVLHVKLTDSAIQRLQNCNSGATLAFKGKTGNLCIQDANKNQQDCFKFTIGESETFENSLTVSTVKSGRQLEKAGAVSKDVIRFEATSDTFNKVGEQFKNIQEERGKQSTVLLEDQFSSNKNLRQQTKLNTFSMKRKISVEEPYSTKRQRNIAPKNEPNVNPISSALSNPSAHDQGYETGSEESSSETKTSCKDDNYKLLYTDINTVFLVKYKPITSDSQRNIYKHHFDLDYPKYLKTHKLLEVRYSRFYQKKRSQNVSNMRKALVDQTEIENEKSVVKSFKYLHEKLRFIKYCVKNYDLNK